MGENTSPSSRRRKSIMIIDEKGHKGELFKDRKEKKGDLPNNESKPMKDESKKDDVKKSGGEGVVIIDQEKRKAEEARRRGEEKKTKDPCDMEGACHDQNKKVAFNEGQNKEYEVQKDKDKAMPLSPKESVDGKTEYVKKHLSGDANNAFVPPILTSSNMAAGSEILNHRNENNIAAEGWMWKKRRIFKCFWHQKYFVLTKEGILKYYKVDGRRMAKGNWNIREATGIEQDDMPPEECHPFRMMVSSPSKSILFGFDERNVRDYWVEVLNRIIRKR